MLTLARSRFTDRFYAVCCDNRVCFRTHSLFALDLLSLIFKQVALLLIILAAACTDRHAMRRERSLNHWGTDYVKGCFRRNAGEDWQNHQGSVGGPGNSTGVLMSKTGDPPNPLLWQPLYYRRVLCACYTLLLVL